MSNLRGDIVAPALELGVYKSFISQLSIKLWIKLRSVASAPQAWFSLWSLT
jgi:hypothetical protein